MDIFSEYLQGIQQTQHYQRTKEVLDWVGETFPDLEPKIAWNQPMFTDHGTYIIGFSISKLHMSISPERQGMEYFESAITEAGYGQSKMLFRIKWEQPVNYELLTEIIQFNRLEKENCKTFWR